MVETRCTWYQDIYEETKTRFRIPFGEELQKKIDFMTKKAYPTFIFTQ